MNTVTFAGVPADIAGERSNKNFEIIVPEGRCRIDFAGGTALFCAGEIAVVPPRLKHRFEGRGLFVGIEQALLPFKTVTVVQDDDMQGIAHAARCAQKYFAGGAKNMFGLMEALGGLITAYLVEFCKDDGLSPVAAIVKEQVEKNLSDPTFSLKDSLKKLPLNYDYVRKLFKAETGLTPHEYLVEKRMKLAHDLLTNGLGNRYSDYSVAQVAEACGFAEPLYFSRVFKKYFGVSPTDYSKKRAVPPVEGV